MQHIIYKVNTNSTKIKVETMDGLTANAWETNKGNKVLPLTA